MSYLFFAWTACFFYGLNGVFAKLISKHTVKNPYLLNFLWGLFFLIFLIPLLPFQPLAFPARWPSLAATSVLWATTGVTYVYLLSKMDVSALAPLYNLRTVFSVFLGVIFLGENLTTSQYLLVGVIISSGVLVNLDEHFSLRPLIRPLTILLLFHMLFLAIYNALLKVTIAENDYWSVFYWTAIIGQILLLPTIPLFRREVKLITGKQLATTAFIALISLLANLAANKAFADNVALSSAIISLPFSLVLAFLFSVFAPKLLEKHTLKVYAIRFTATALMFLAALRLSP